MSTRSSAAGRGGSAGGGLAFASAGLCRGRGAVGSEGACGALVLGERRPAPRVRSRHARAHEDDGGRVPGRSGEASWDTKARCTALPEGDAALGGLVREAHWRDHRTISRAAKQLGISDMTLRSWMRVADASGQFAHVTVSDESSPDTAATLTLTTLHGHVIGPLDIETAAALVRALS